MKFLIFAVCSINFLFAQDKIYIDFNSNPYVSKLAEPDNDSQPDYFTLLINNREVQIDSKGKCKKLKFSINIDKGCVIKSIEYFQMNSAIIFFQITETNFDVAGSKIIKFNLTKKKKIWEKGTGGFNVDRFIVYGQSIYVNSIGFLGKINKESGKYIWKHDDLYEKYKASFFENLIIRDNTVEGIIYRYINNKWKLIFDKKTGNLVNIIQKDI